MHLSHILLFEMKETMFPHMLAASASQRFLNNPVFYSEAIMTTIINYQRGVFILLPHSTAILYYIMLYEILLIRIWMPDPKQHIRYPVMFLCFFYFFSSHFISYYQQLIMHTSLSSSIDYTFLSSLSILMKFTNVCLDQLVILFKREAPCE